MLIAVIPLLVAVAGALVYALAANPKLAEMGRLAFACGVLALMFALSGKSVSLLG
jgi:sugar/nucleoside kinase (ribokinase family)